MGDMMEQDRTKQIKWYVFRALLLVFDIVTANAAFYIALMLRFYVQSEVLSIGVPYMEAFSRYSPIYTIYVVAVFVFFRLYSSMWQYVGINDLNRILLANLVCLVGHVIGTLLFSRRMPISFYAVGSFIQLFLTTGSRMSYRVFQIEKSMIMAGNNRPSINAMIVGTGEVGRSVLKQLERENAVSPVCILSYRGSNVSGMLNGVPFVSGLENLKKSLDKYEVHRVIIADTLMPEHIRQRIKDTCQESNVEVQDFTGFFQNSGAKITLKSLVEYTSCPIELILNGFSQTFKDGEEALMNAHGNYVVNFVGAKQNTLVIGLSSHDVQANSINEKWIKKAEKELGEEISFF